MARRLPREIQALANPAATDGTAPGSASLAIIMGSVNCSCGSAAAYPGRANRSGKSSAVAQMTQTTRPMMTARLARITAVSHPNSAWMDQALRSPIEVRPTRRQ